MNTPTPRTDAIVHEKWIPPVIDCVPADFARQLERELAEAQKDRDEWQAIADEAIDYLMRRVDASQFPFCDLLARFNAKKGQQ